MTAQDGAALRCLLIKLGGSLITDKTGVRSVRRGILKQLAQDLAQFLEQVPPDVRVIVGHGSGSFGHAAAAGTALDPSHDGDEDLVQAAVRTQEAAAALHQVVSEELVASGVPAFSFAPGSFLVTRDGSPERLFVEPLLGALFSGAHLLVRGDVAVDRQSGFRIVSTETVLAALVDELGKQLRVLGAVWLGETAGLLDSSGLTVPEIEPSCDVDALIGSTRGTDVTGGMAHRLAFARRLAEQGVPSLLLDGRQPGRLRLALEHLLTQGGEVFAGATLVPSTP